jgi:hypothetical protein
LGALIPYLIPLAVLVLMYRRIGRVRPVRVNRLWVMPAIIAFATWSAIHAFGFPTFLWLIAYVIAAVAGAAVGYLRASHTHLAVHPETGDVQATQTPIATAILMALFVAKFAINMMFPQLNGGQRPSIADMFTPDSVDAMSAASHASHTAATINYATDTLLVFSTVLFITAAAETWMRASRLLAEHRGEKGEVTED